MTNWYKISQTTQAIPATPMQPTQPTQPTQPSDNIIDQQQQRQQLIEELKSQHPDINNLINSNPKLKAEFDKYDISQLEAIKYDPNKVQKAIGALEYANIRNQPLTFTEALGQAGIDLMSELANWALDIL